ncbi:MAG: hypothetical protein MJK04_03210 [Psychrosphaera sp.]|nr:hypothetical protein [Psychrosphaera sp.]
MISFFSLQKLTITQLKPEDHTPTDKVFKVMFNPENYQESYGVGVSATKLASGGQKQHLTDSSQNKTKFTLLLDDSYVHKYLWQRVMTPRVRVEKQIDRLFDITGYGKRSDDSRDIHPMPLSLKWGRLNYTCVLENISVKYDQFDRDGMPTRAALETVFLSIDSPAETVKKETTDHEGNPIVDITITIN